MHTKRLPLAEDAAPAMAQQRMTTSTAPNWDLVHFDTSCARCGHDLRGLEEPKCPACSLEFDWDQAVPLESLTCAECSYHLYGLNETRCPECGQAFTWNGALAAFHRRKYELFEYHWRKKPVRSFLKSWYLGLRSAKLWRHVNIHDKPEIKPLAVMAFASVSFCTVMTPMMLGLFNWLVASMNYWRMRYSWRDLPFDELGSAILKQFANGALYMDLLLLVLWCALSLAALLIFRQSMRRYKVRNAHVFRVWAYAVPLALSALPFALFAWLTGIWLLEESNLSYLVPSDALPVIALAAAGGILVIFPIRSIGNGYKHYLKMDHSVAVAVSSQIIAILATPVLLILIRWIFHNS